MKQTSGWNKKLTYKKLNNSRQRVIKHIVPILMLRLSISIRKQYNLTKRTLAIMLTEQPVGYL